MIDRRLEGVVDRVADKAPPVKIPAGPETARTTAQRVAYLLSGAHPSLPEADAVLAALNRDLPGALKLAFEEGDPAALLDVHQALFVIYEVSFGDPLAPWVMQERSAWLVEVRNAIEASWLNYELPRIEPELPTESDLRDAERLCAWFIAQAQRESALDRRVVAFLAEEATIEHFKTFILADAPLNYRFYDALALAQLHYSEAVKAEISQHMWDECGRGVGENAHTRQFTRALLRLGLPPSQPPIWNDWRPYAGYNLYLCFGLNRRHYFKALGSLAMPELFDPGRDSAVVTGLERLGFNAREDFEYYYNHIGGDEEHGARWLSHVITPVVAAQSAAARELAVGAAWRMAAMRRYNEYLAREFGLSAESRS